MYFRYCKGRVSQIKIYASCIFDLEGTGTVTSAGWGIWFGAFAYLTAAACSVSASAEQRHFKITIEDTIQTLVGNQTFHTFAFNGQVPVR